jgi:hypothetical protein
MRADVQAGAGLRPSPGFPRGTDLKKGDPLPGFMHAVSGDRCNEHRHGWKVRRSRIAPAISKPPAVGDVVVSSRCVRFAVCERRATTRDLVTSRLRGPASSCCAGPLTVVAQWRFALSAVKQAKTLSVPKGLDKDAPHGRRGVSPIPDRDPKDDLGRLGMLGRNCGIGLISSTRKIRRSRRSRSACARRNASRTCST